MLNSIRKIFVQLRRDERGATLVEYAIALLIAIGVGGVVANSLAGKAQDNFCDADEVMGGTPATDCTTQ